MWLHWAEYLYNTSYHSTLKTSHFRVVYGREPPPLIRYGVRQAVIDLVDNLLAKRDAWLKELKQHLRDVQLQMK